MTELLFDDLPRRPRRLRSPRRPAALLTPAKVLTLARKAGLTISLSGSDLLVSGLDSLPAETATDWRTRLKAEKAALIEALGGREDQAGALLRELGITVVTVTDPAKADTVLAELIAAAGGKYLAIDFETAPNAGELRRAFEASKAAAAAKGRAKALRHVGDHAGAEAAVEEVAYQKRLATEAGRAGLDPHRASIRAVQVYAGGSTVAVFDCYEGRVSLADLAPLFAEHLVAHNSAFELKFLRHAGIEPVHPLACTMQMSGLFCGPHRRSLKAAAFEVLALDLSKAEQAGDWSAPNLAPAQLHYAALDAVACYRLAHQLGPTLDTRRPAYLLQRDCQAVCSDMERRGILLDQDAHQVLMADLKAERAAIAAGFVAACLDLGRPDLAEAGIPKTPERKREVLKAVLSAEEQAGWTRTKATGELSTRRSDLKRAAHHDPVKALADASVLDKVLSAFGPGLAGFTSPVTGRIHASFNVGATATGRASGGRPNLQQIPRDPRFRHLFIAAPSCVLVGADYASMELRAAAWISGDRTMTEAFARGDDLHLLTASALTGKPLSDVTKEERSAAKAVNFGSIFGIGPRGLRHTAWDNYGLVLTEEQAQAQLDTFRRTYPQLHDWKVEHYRTCEQRGFILIGRDALQGTGREFWLIWNGDRDRRVFPQTCNLPVQGQCADAAMLALVKLAEALRGMAADGGPVLWLHDEIVIEVEEVEAKRAAYALEMAMVDAFAEIFPGAPLNGLVSVGQGLDWAAAKGG